MTATPTVSVILLNYNHATYLPTALHGILSQTRRPLEVLIVDDASTDDSTAVITQAIGSAAHCRLIRNETNRGVIANANRMMREARASHVYFAAADDLILPAFLERSMAMLSDHPTAALCSTHSETMDAAGQTRGVLSTGSFQPHRSMFLPPELVRDLMIRHGSWIRGNTTVFRRDALIEAGGFRPELGPYCDGFVEELIAMRHGACFIPEPLCVWRRLPDTFSSKTAGDVEQSRRIRDAARRLMTDEYPDVFPKAYVDRWAARYDYGMLTTQVARRAAQLRGTLATLAERIAVPAIKLASAVVMRPADIAQRLRPFRDSQTA